MVSGPNVYLSLFCCQLGGAVVPHDGECHLDKMGAGGKYMESVAKTLVS